MKLRMYRAMANLTQQELSERLGLSELSIIKYEGGTTIPSREVMLRIYQLTGGLVTPNDFFDLEAMTTNASGNAPDSTFVAAGLMSGTSMDGIDAALLITDGKAFIKDIGHVSLEYDETFKALLKSCEQACFEGEGDLERAKDIFRAPTGITATFDDVIRQSTDLHAKALQNLLRETAYKARSVDVVGYHGQTLFHRPSIGITVQAGDGQFLADNSGITTVYDFRSNDVKHGGQGAPFAPLYHRAIANQIGLTPLVIANCGGIANITVIGSSDEDLFAYDCGPGNALIDKFVRLKVGKSMDKDGIFGSNGQVVPHVLEALRQKAICDRQGESYLQRQPPKSLDANDLLLIPEVKELSLQDGCATLEAFTAECMVNSLDGLPFAVPKLWVLAGGGWRNKVIVRELEEKLRNRLGADMRVQHAEQVGWNSQALEAQIFAYLAVRTLNKLPLSLPGTTGVSQPLTGGKIVLPEMNAKKATRNVQNLLAG